MGNNTSPFLMSDVPNLLNKVLHVPYVLGRLVYHWSEDVS